MTEEVQHKPLDCAFDSVQDVFALNIDQAVDRLSEVSLDEYYQGAEFFAKIGQGDKLSIAFLKTMPWVGEHFGDGSIKKNCRLYL